MMRYWEGYERKKPDGGDKEEENILIGRTIHRTCLLQWIMERKVEGKVGRERWRIGTLINVKERHYQAIKQDTQYRVVNWGHPVQLTLLWGWTSLPEDSFTGRWNIKFIGDKTTTTLSKLELTLSFACWYLEYIINNEYWQGYSVQFCWAH